MPEVPQPLQTWRCARCGYVYEAFFPVSSVTCPKNHAMRLEKPPVSRSPSVQHRLEER
jgi:hypothetical protein